jgi:DNA-binding XRE family transcriptional regulator
MDTRHAKLTYPSEVQAGDENLEIEQIIKNVRHDFGMTQEEMADYLGVNKWTYIAFENGRGDFHTSWLTNLPRDVRKRIVTRLVRREQRIISYLRDLVEEPEEEPAADPVPVVLRRPTASALTP